MKTYAEFYHRGVISNQLIPACGDRSVIRLDGRQSSTTHHSLARYWACERGYLAYRLIKGRELLDAQPISPIVEV